MKNVKNLFRTILALAVPLALSLPLPAAAPLEINYQGKLTDSGGVPLSGGRNLRFSFWTLVTGGSQIGGNIDKSVTAVNGVFSVVIDGIPVSTFRDNSVVYLEVRDLGLPGPFARQKLTGSPYALAIANDTVGSAEIRDGVIDNVDISGSAGIATSKIDFAGGSIGLGGALSVTGNSTLTGNTGVGAAPGVEKLRVAGTAAVTGNTTVGGTLGVTGNTTLSSALGVTGNSTLSGTLGVAGQTTLSAKTGIGGAPSVGTELLKVTGDAEVTGALSADSLAVNTWITLPSNVTVSNLDVQTGVHKTGAGKLALDDTDGTDVSGDLTVTGTKNLAVSGGNATVGGALGVTGNTTLTGNTGVGGAPSATASTDLRVAQNAEVAGQMYVIGQSTFTGNVGVGGSPSGTDKFKVTGTANVTGNTRLDSQLYVVGQSTFNDLVGVAGAPEAGSELRVHGKIKAEDIEISNTATLPPVTLTSIDTNYLTVSSTSGLTGNVGVGGSPSGTASTDLRVVQNAEIGGEMYVVGQSTFTGNVGVGGSPSGSDKLRVAGTANVTGNTRLDSQLYVIGQSTFTGNMGVGGSPSGTDKFKVTGAANVTGNTKLDSQLYVVGQSTLTGNVGVGGSPSATDKFKVTGAANVTGNTKLDSQLYVIGVSTLGGNVGVGTAPGTEALKVVGDVSLGTSADVVAVSTLTIGGGDPLHKFFIDEQSWNTGSFNAGEVKDNTFTINGVNRGDFVMVSILDAVSDGFSCYALANDTDSVTLHCRNMVGGPNYDPGTPTFRFGILKN